MVCIRQKRVTSVENKCQVSKTKCRWKNIVVHVRVHFLFLRQVSETKCRWENIFVRAHVHMRLLFLLAHVLAHSYLFSKQAIYWLLSIKQTALKYLFSLSRYNQFSYPTPTLGNAIRNFTCQFLPFYTPNLFALICN